MASHEMVLFFSTWSSSCSKLAWAHPHVGSRFLKEQEQGLLRPALKLAHDYFRHIPLAKATQRPVQIQEVEKSTPHLDAESFEVTLKRDTGK